MWHCSRWPDIDAELYARIGRLFFADHWKVGTIATELGVHHETVEHAIEADRFVRAPRQIRPSLLDAPRSAEVRILDFEDAFSLIW